MFKKTKKTPNTFVKTMKSGVRGGRVVGVCMCVCLWGVGGWGNLLIDIK